MKMMNLTEYQKGKTKATEMNGMLVLLDNDIDKIFFLGIKEDAFKTYYWIKKTPKSKIGKFCASDRLFIQQF